MCGGGHIIVLDGASSAGKSTLARSLQQVLDAPYWHVSQDHFWQMLPPKGTDQRNNLTPEGCLSGFHQAITGIAASGNNLIVDTGFLDKAWLVELVHLLTPYRVFFVAVYCSLDELKRRERQRGDRPEGYTQSQIDRVYHHGFYDMEIDTSTRTPEACALLLKEALSQATSPSAFQQMSTDT
ncbi:MAG: AAA family ATPase [Armatimonadota bacterium]